MKLDISINYDFYPFPLTSELGIIRPSAPEFQSRSRRGCLSTPANPHLTDQPNFTTGGLILAH